MMAYARWNTSANATRSTAANVYSFSQPPNLIIPYFVSLAVAVPFLLLGGWALVRNGVSAADGGFMQIITTSTGSAILDSAAAGVASAATRAHRSSSSIWRSDSGSWSIVKTR